MGGLSIVIRCLIGRRPIVLCDRDFDRELVARLLERCTLASLVPALLRLGLRPSTLAVLAREMIGMRLRRTGAWRLR